MEVSVERDTNVFLPMNVTVIRNSGSLMNPKSGIWREDKAYVTLEVCHPRCVCRNWKGYIVRHNYVN